MVGGALTVEGHEADIRRDMLVLLPDLRGFARFMVRDLTIADDLVQDTLVRALAAIQQFRPGTNLKAWLFTILRHVFYEQARRRKREMAMLSAQWPLEEAGGDTTAAADLKDLQRLLWTLPALQREALVLVGAQQLTHEEAASVCGVPVGTMKARVSRARALLARSIGAAAESPVAEV